MMAVCSRGLVLGVFPTSRGLGWVALTSPLHCHDYGLVEAAKDKNSVCLRRVDRLLEELRPEVLVLEAFDGRTPAPADRVARLCRAMIASANLLGVEVHVYGRPDIEQCFATAGARSRQEIAEAVARILPMLAYRLPIKRKPWKSDDRRMGLFNAAALALTHYHYEALGLLSERAGP